MTAWGLLGSYNWHTLVTRDDRHYEPGVFDVRAPTPRPTALAAAVRALADGTPPAHPVLATPGWWRRPTRRFRAARRRSAPSRDTPGILIVGSRGPLRSALERICHERGLACHVVDERAGDVTGASSIEKIETITRRQAVWAVSTPVIP